MNRIECVTPLRPARDGSPTARKTVITKLDNQYYLTQMYYQYKDHPGVWLLGSFTRAEYAIHAKGRVSSTPDTDRLMQYLCQYEGFYTSILNEEEWNSIHIKEDKSNG